MSTAPGPRVRIIADSVSPAGVRITTLGLTYWRAIHAEVLTHRMLSRNASSSRAEPVSSTVRRVSEAPEVPLHWGRTQKGMQADDRLRDVGEVRAARGLWLSASRKCADVAGELAGLLGIHKQVANRLIEPFVSIDVVATATDWDNFLALRCHPMAEPHLRIMAWRIADLMHRGPAPTRLEVGEWHLPFVTDNERREHHIDVLKQLSVARCARTSYRRHDGANPVVADDVALYQRLLNDTGDALDPGHWSPFEHQATPLEDADARSGNFRGWLQHRQQFPRQVATFDYAAAVAAGWRDLAYECLSDVID